MNPNYPNGQYRQARRVPPQMHQPVSSADSTPTVRKDSPMQPKAKNSCGTKRPKVQFSKILTGFIAITMYPVSIYVIIECLDLAKLAIERGFTGSLPYITAIVGFVEAAITIVMACYFDNSKAEKVAGYKSGAFTAMGGTIGTSGNSLNRDF